MTDLETEQNSKNSLFWGRIKDCLEIYVTLSEPVTLWKRMTCEALIRLGKIESSTGDVDFICWGIYQSLTIKSLMLTWQVWLMINFVREMNIVLCGPIESTPRGGVNRCKTNLMTNDAELKTKCNTLSITKECSRIPSKGLWTISSKFL